MELFKATFSVHWLQGSSSQQETLVTNWRVRIGSQDISLSPFICILRSILHACFFYGLSFSQEALEMVLELVS